MRRITVTIVLFLVFIPLQLFSQGWDDHINVHFYPQTLVPRDILTDGPEGRAFRITEDTFLVWVDLSPDMFFEHETCYILISKNHIRVKKGRWWPVLNRKRLFMDGQGQFALISPFEMPWPPGNSPTGDEISVHVYPHELTSRDRLQDGPLERLFRIHDNSLFIWVDRLPGAFFAHPTAYILISKQDVQVEAGIWWPELNGRKILYGEGNRIGIISPFKVSWNR
ncbi:MAG: hypothetical protein WBB73_06675 [Candidatus Aminicenantaceae bacterium]